MRRLWRSCSANLCGSKMRFAVLLLAIATCNLRTVHGLQPMLLDLTSGGIRVTATAECGADGPTEYAVCSDGPDCVRTCGRDNGEIAHHAELAVDGDRSTSWQSPPLSFYQARGETIGSHNLTIDLGREVYVVEVEVYAGEGMLPATTELYLSVDGTTFTQIASLDLPLSKRKEVVIVVMNVTDDVPELSGQQKAASYARYLKLSLLAPPTSIVTSDPRSGFYSVGEVSLQVVELEVCPLIDLECHGEPVIRRTQVLLRGAALHRLLWQRSNQSDWWIIDNVTLLVEGCPGKEGGCERGGRVREDFNGSTLNSVVWDSDSFLASTIIGTRPCSNPRDIALLIPPGDQIISRSLMEVTRGVVFDAEFPLLPPFCRMGAEYSPVEVRLCRSIEGVLGECQLVGLVSRSECGNCLDQLTFQLRYLQESIDSALFPANLTVLDDLHTDLHTTLYQLEALEGLVLVLKVAFGSLPTLPPSAPPPPILTPRLDLQLVPPILTKLQELQDLLDQMPSISVVPRDDLVAIYTDLRFRLGELLTQADILQSDQRALSVTVSILLRSFSDIIDAISVARETAIVISSRQYLSTQVRVQLITREVVQTLEMADRFVGLAQTNHQHMGQVADSLMGVGELLVKAGNLVQEVVSRANSTEEFVRQAEFVEQEIMSLLNEAEDVLEGVGVALQEGEVAVATGDQLLSMAREIYENASLTLPNVIRLMTQVNQTIQSYSSRLAGLVQDPPCQSGGDNCTRGEEHATDLGADHAFIVNSSVSVYTLRYANDTLSALESVGTPLDLALINSTALTAQQRALAAIDQLAGISATLDSVTSIVLLVEQLRDLALDSLATSTSLSVTVNTSLERKGQLDAQLEEQQIDLFNLNDGMEGVASRDGITDEAILLLSRANSSLEVVRSAEGRVEEVREGVRETRGQLDQITSNVQRAETTLQDSEQRFPLVSRLLTATRSQAETALFNVSDFIAENDRIVRDIDSLISRLSTVHSNIGLINSPVRLSSEPGVSEAVPYLSLQPPPGRQLGGGVQFDDLDLYMWPSAQYQTPSLLFYAGPVRYPDQQNRTQPETREDVVWVVAEEDQLRLGWELGGYRANTIYPARVEGDSLLRLTRVGSQFQLQFSPSSGEGILKTTLVNSSLLFYSSERTAFLLGGWPRGAQLGSVDAPLPLSSLRGFEGQFQLALFNGDLWGLWNVRSTSDTDLIGDKEFRRNGLARNVAWHAGSGQLRSSSAISFDGRGYLFTEQFGTVADFSTGATFQTIMLFLRPNDASRGLAMYAYQPQRSVSLEVFYRDGYLNVLISHHDNSNSEVVVNHTEVASRDEVTEVSIRYLLGSRRYVINGQLYRVTTGDGRFFTNLRQVKAWFGGVRGDRLEGSYVPREMTGYFGCVDMYVLKNFETLFEIFLGPSFTEYYLNSPVQSGLSATCYATVYVSEVSFAAGSEGLAYTYLPLPPRSCVFDPSLLSHSISLSLLPLVEDGYVLTIADQNTTLSVVLRSGVVEVTVASGTDTVSLASQEPLELGVWHYLLLSLDLPNHPDAEFSLFLNDLLQEAVSSLPQFSLALPTSAPVGVANPLPVLFVGGVPATYDPGARVAIFKGCLKHLTFNLCPLSFQAPSLVERYPLGVNYHTCPSSAVVSIPELPVRPAPPQQRVCLGAEPVELDFTHGGFARDTELRSSNVAGLLGREWILTFTLQQRSPGHVISVRSVTGESVKVEVVDGGHLLMTATCNSTFSSSAAMSPPLPPNVFTPVAISCAVDSSTFLCNLTVDGIVEVAHVPVCAGGEDTSLFDPALPITLGMVRDDQGNMVEGFEGCIADLALNGDGSGFQDVVTGVPCYNKTLPGIGLTGTSRLSQLLPAPSTEVVIELSVRPLLESGVVMVLTEPVSAQLVLAVGLVRGVLRVSNSSDGYLTIAEGVCDPTNVVTFDLTVRYTESRISVGVAGSDVVLSPPPSVPEIEQLVLTIGNIPEDLPSGEDLFFLQSDTMLPSTAPAGLAGCLVSGSLLGEALSLSSVDHTENILNGFCPDA